MLHRHAVLPALVAAALCAACEGFVASPGTPGGPPAPAPGGPSPVGGQATVLAPLPGSPACVTAGAVAAPLRDELVVTLRAASGLYLSAECGGDALGALRADAQTPGEWERFYLRLFPDGSVTLRTSHGRFVSADGGGGAQAHARDLVGSDAARFRLDGLTLDGMALAFKASDGAHWLSARLDASPPVVTASGQADGPWERFVVQVLQAPTRQRRGVVRADHRTFVDDDGPFYPLGATLFWSLRGWKHEQARVKQNLQYLRLHGFDYVRILGEVDWPGNEIDPAWPDWAQALGEFVDYAYDVCGLRTELTLVGSDGDPLALAQAAAPVVNAARAHKFLNLEVANESYARPVTLAQLEAAGRYLMQHTPNLVALSSAEGLSSYAPNTADWRADFLRLYMPQGAANLGTVHMDRGYGDDGWRIARQPWDWKDFPVPISHNEPIGPRSSVAEEVDPIRLAMLRAVGLVNGVGAFVLHNGAGVAGQVDAARNRPANLWEVPGIDAVMRAVRGVDAFVPPRAGEGTHWNNAWAGNPWVVDAFWGDGDPHGVNRNYTVSTPDGWVSTEAGVKDFAVFTAARASRVEIFDVLAGKVAEVTLAAGQTHTLTPHSRDDKGYGAFIVVGHYL